LSIGVFSSRLGKFTRDIITGQENPDSACYGFSSEQEALGESTVKGWVEAGKLHKIGPSPHVQNYMLGMQKKFLKDPLSDLVTEEIRKK
jgi:hypothetical protein